MGGCAFECPFVDCKSTPHGQLRIFFGHIDPPERRIEKKAHLWRANSELGLDIQMSRAIKFIELFVSKSPTSTTKLIVRADTSYKVTFKPQFVLH